MNTGNQRTFERELGKNEKRTKRSHDSAQLLGCDSSIAITIKKGESLLELSNLLFSQCVSLIGKEKKERKCKTSFKNDWEAWYEQDKEWQSSTKSTRKRGEENHNNEISNERKQLRKKGWEISLKTLSHVINPYTENVHSHKTRRREKQAEEFDKSLLPHPATDTNPKPEEHTHTHTLERTHKIKKKPAKNGRAWSECVPC